MRGHLLSKIKRGATANVANKVISGETKVTLNQSFTITLEGGLTFKDTVKENNDVSEWFAKDNLPKGLTAKITNVNDNKKSATITRSGIPTVKSEADILITIPQNSLEGAAANMPVNMQGAKYAIKEFYMPTGGGGGGAAAKPPSQRLRSRSLQQQQERLRRMLPLQQRQLPTSMTKQNRQR